VKEDPCPECGNEIPREERLLYTELCWRCYNRVIREEMIKEANKKKHEEWGNGKGHGHEH